MQNHLDYQTGYKVVTGFNSLGNVTYGPETILRYRSVDQVQDYVLTEGDKSKPNNFAYRAMRENYWKGDRIAESLFGGKWYTAELQSGFIDDSAGPTLSARAFPAFPREQAFHYNRALGRINDRVRGQLDLSVSALEWAETRRMLGSMHKASSYIGNTLRGISVGRKADLIKDILKDAGGSYLQWHLAWEPLINDLYSSVGELYRHLSDGALTLTSSSNAKVSGLQPLTKRSSTDPQEMAPMNGIQGCRFHLKYKDKGGFDIRRYTSLNPLSLLWERAPLSFVFDYFWDLGSLLRNTETALLYDSEFVSGYYTELYALSCAQSCDVIGYNDGATRVRFRASSDFSYKNFKRTVLGSYPLPRLPTWKVDLGSAQLLTVASLLAQQFR